MGSVFPCYSHDAFLPPRYLSYQRLIDQHLMHPQHLGPDKFLSLQRFQWEITTWCSHFLQVSTSTPGNSTTLMEIGLKLEAIWTQLRYNRRSLTKKPLSSVCSYANVNHGKCRYFPFSPPSFFSNCIFPKFTYSFFLAIRR